MKRVVGLVAGVAVLVVGVVPIAVAAETGRVPAVERSLGERVMWQACPATDSKTAVAASMECATVRVPLDHREPWGHSIKVAINRIKAKVSRDGNHLGTLLVNPGGPGASGRTLAQYVAAALPGKLAERYDVVGFDPRGVGASQPALRCVDPEVYYRAPRPDAVPRTRSDENVLLSRAAQYANQCGNLWSWLLPYMTTENVARDLDTIRAALGEEKISYLGYSYGTYIGSVYATLFPERVKRLVLDSAVDPDNVWYEANLTQDRAFERRHRAFLAWTARHNSVYGLGQTTKQARFAWYAMRARLHDRPAGGLVGASELDDVFTVAGYSDKVWPEFAAAWSAYVRRGDPKLLIASYDRHGTSDAEDENGYAVYLATQCRDAAWPRDWARWRTDMTRMHRRAPFLTWPNAWYNAPCAFWPVAGGTPVKVQGTWRLPPILVIQSRGDAATPYAGAVNLLRHFPTARMVEETGGNHGVALGGNRCVDRHLLTYLTDGTVPPQGTRCQAQPEPRPAAHMGSGGVLGHERLTEVLAR
ncbi:alpha/beta hydrolase [Nonomuraea sp. LPB2021202275-12-8]|uniref:alpha/beta hydrolase n=1 Tax=Nonomuraea sp. LPB2021202275-12-8 TaxID=3120159 RepID=UPI00300D8263